MLQRRERGKDLSRRVPIQGTHGEMVVRFFSDSELLFEIIERIETMRSIEFLVIFSVRTLNLAVVPWSTDTDQLVLDS